jgi:hypothetical protein
MGTNSPLHSPEAEQHFVGFEKGEENQPLDQNFEEESWMA